MTNRVSQQHGSNRVYQFHLRPNQRNYLDMSKGITNMKQRN